MKRAHTGWVGTTVIATGVVVYGGLIVLGIGYRDAQVGWQEPAVYMIYVLVGGIVLRHSAHNPIGWFVTVMGLVLLLGNLADAVLARGPGPGLVTDLATWIVGWYFFVFLGTFLPLLHVFPSGGPMPGVWRWWYRLAVFGSGILVFVYLFGPPNEGVNPYAVPLVTAIKRPLEVSAGVILITGLATGVASLGVRFRRSRGRERAQLKWFFFSVIVGLVLFVGSGLLGERLRWIPAGLGDALAGSAFPLPAIGILIAVTRHGLFDIDRVVSRTVSYAALALIIAGVYVLPVLVLPEVLGLSSDLAVATATLAAAAVFAPLRKRLQSVVDRRFDRAHYDAERVVASFSGRLQSAVDLGRVTDELGRAVGTTLHPASLSLWFSDLAGTR